MSMQDIERFVSHRCHCPGNPRHAHLSARYVRRVRRFVRFLAERGVVPATELPATKAIDEQVAEFQDWLRRHRGISSGPSTVTAAWSCDCFPPSAVIRRPTMPALSGT